MFGQRFVGNKKDVPDWIMKIVDEIERSYDFCLDAVYFKEPTRNKEYRGACYSPRDNNIQLYFGKEKTDLRVWIVLHELAHARQYLCAKDTLTKKGNRKKRVVHNDMFWKMAKEMFVKYGVLDVAIKNEYKRGRKKLAS